MEEKDPVSSMLSHEGSPSGDMNPLLLLVKCLSVGLLCGILGFNGCYKLRLTVVNWHLKSELDKSDYSDAALL